MFYFMLLTLCRLPNRNKPELGKAFRERGGRKKKQSINQSIHASCYISLSVWSFIRSWCSCSLATKSKTSPWFPSRCRSAFSYGGCRAAMSSWLLWVSWHYRKLNFTSVSFLAIIHILWHLLFQVDSNAGHYGFCWLESQVSMYFIGTLCNRPMQPFKFPHVFSRSNQIVVKRLCCCHFKSVNKCFQRSQINCC